MTPEVAVVGRAGGGALDVSAYAPGVTVRVLPNHSCMTAAMFDRYHVVAGAPRADGARAIVATWTPCKYWAPAASTA